MQRGEQLGKMSTLTENENAVHGKQKETVHREMHTFFATMPENVHQTPLLPFTLQNRKRKTIGEILRKTARRGNSPSENFARSRSKITLKEIT